MLPGIELMNCPEMAVPREVMHHVVKVESSYNRYAIGVVGGHLVRQPRNLPEAIATVKMLERKGYNFSLGLAQVNRYNLKKYGLDSYAHAFEACPNLQAGARILAACHRRHQDWGKSFSCYYSGNAVTGFRHGYVQKIFASMAAGVPRARGDEVDGATGIPVVSRPHRRAVAVEHFPAGDDRSVATIEARTSAAGTSGAPAADRGVGSAPFQPVPAADHQASASAPETSVPANPGAPVVLQATPSTTSALPAAPMRAEQGDAAFVF